MYIPLAALIVFALIACAYFVLDVVSILRRRHHDHLISDTPRSPRG